jgi:hypothetical protein
MGLYEHANPEKDHNGSPSAGSSGAVQIEPDVSTVIDVFYNVGAATDALRIEGSRNGSDWRELDETVASGSITTGGDVVSVRTAYSHVRAYAGSGFADGDVNELEIVSKGL